jgi:diguanylate cyclase (GGDEF)-like protein
VGARRPAIASDLYFGAVSGFGFSALIWCLISTPTSFEPGVAAFVALGALFGTRRLRVGRNLRFTPVVGVSLAALISIGLGPAVAVSAAAALRTGLAGGREMRCGPLRDVAFTFGAACISTTFGGLVYLALGGSAAEPLTGRLALPVIGYLACQALTQTCLAAQAVSLISPRRALHFPPSRFVRWSIALAVETASAVGIVLCYQAPLGRMIVLCAPAVWFVLGLGRTFERRTTRGTRRLRPSQAIYRSITRGLSEGSAVRDRSMRHHLRRVEELCRGVARRMELSRDEKEALAAAAQLHQIGDIAIDPRIDVHPGSPRNGERRRVVVHPGVATEMIRAIGFPYPVEPIMRHRHERWDGRGYPDGLEGVEIPVGARILAAVAGFVALTRDTPASGGLSVNEALACLRRDAGRCFDPEVVDRLVACVAAHESFEFDVPQAGATAESTERVVVPELASAERQLSQLYEIEALAERPLPLDERLTLIAERLREIVAYSSFVVYHSDDRRGPMRASFAYGFASGRLRKQALPATRLSGRAALERRSFFGELNRDGSMSAPWHAEFDLTENDGDLGRLRSFVVAPMVAEGGELGTLALYDVEGRGFTANDCQIVVHVAGQLAQTLRSGETHRAADLHRLTDPLTGLPNAHYLRLETAQRIAPLSEQAAEFGVLAFHVGSLTRVRERHGKSCADRMLSLTARRLAAACTAGETPVRLGRDQYLVLTPMSRAGELVQRWDDLLRVVGSEPVEIDRGTLEPTGLVAAHASCPADGDSLDDLLSVLDARLSVAGECKGAVLPFRPSRSA